MALVGAGSFGVWSARSGVSVDGAQISSSAVRAELAAIASSPTLDCFLSALSPATFTSGGGGSSLSASGAAAWTGLRVEGLAIDHYVTTRLHHTPSASELAQAKDSLLGELTQAAAANRLNCPGTAAQALAAMTPEMRSAEVRAQAESTYLLSRLNSTIALTSANIQAFYQSHRADYDTICVSVAVVRPSELSAFAQAQKAGMSVANLARKFSLDPSKTKGGAYGCFAPNSSAYSAVRADTAGTAINEFPASPRALQSNGTTYALYVAPTKRTPSTLASAEGAVITDIQSLNASAANVAKTTILEQAAVRVDPAFGTWSVTSSGPAVVAPSAPSASDVNSASLLTTAPTSFYQ